MEPLPVVKHFDPFKDRNLGPGLGGELPAVHQVPFKAAPEALHKRVAHKGDPYPKQYVLLD